MTYSAPSRTVNRAPLRSLLAAHLLGMMTAQVLGAIMRGEGVFVLTEGGALVSMQAASFASEDVFQRLLADYPALLAGDQIDSQAPRRFILISREQGIASEIGGPDRWSVDHLFLDQDGIPTLVEVKRSSDTRIRREVVGQMLDYAANCVVHWSADELRARFIARCLERGADADEALSDLIGPEGDTGAFWEAVRANLQSRRIRMIFVADAIPPELRRIVEFLNEQMNPAEVLALELRQFEGEGLRTPVPLIIGQSQGAAERKSGSPSRPQRTWDEASFFEELTTRKTQAVVEAARTVMEHLKLRATRVFFGKGQSVASFNAAFEAAGQEIFAFQVWSDGSLSVLFQYMIGKPVFDAVDMREELRRRLNAIEGINLPADAITRRPGIQLERLLLGSGIPKLLAVTDWFEDQLATSPASQVAPDTLTAP